MRASIPISAFRVPSGKIAITFDISGLDYCTAVLPVLDLDQILSDFEVEMELSKNDRCNLQAHLQIRHLAEQLLRSGDPDGVKYALFPALWLALNHPVDPGAIRAAISDGLRRNERAHITIAIDHRHYWAFAVSDRIPDLSKWFGAMPDDSSLGMSVRFKDFNQPTGQA